MGLELQNIADNRLSNIVKKRQNRYKVFDCDPSLSAGMYIKLLQKLVNR